MALPSQITFGITAGGGVDVAVTGTGSTIQDANVAAQLSAAATGLTAGVNPYYAAAAITAGEGAFSTQFAVMLNDIHDGNSANWNLKSIQTVAADLLTLVGDATIVVGAVAGSVPGGQQIGTATEVLGDAITVAGVAANHFDVIVGLANSIGNQINTGIQNLESSLSAVTGVLNNAAGAVPGAWSSLQSSLNSDISAITNVANNLGSSGFSSAANAAASTFSSTQSQLANTVNSSGISLQELTDSINGFNSSLSNQTGSFSINDNFTISGDGSQVGVSSSQSNSSVSTNISGGNFTDRINYSNNSGEILSEIQNISQNGPESISVSGTGADIYAADSSVNITSGSTAIIGGSNNTISEQGSNTAWVYGDNNTDNMAANSGAIAVFYGSNETVNASHDSVNVGTNSSVTVNGSGDNLGLIGANVSLTASDDTVNMASNVTGSVVYGNNDDINAGAGFSGNVQGSHDTVNMDPNGGDYLGIYGTDQKVNNDTGNDYANVAGDGTSVDFTGTGNNFGVVSNNDDITASHDNINLLSGISGDDFDGSYDTFNAGSNDSFDVDGSDDHVNGNSSDNVDFSGGDYSGDGTSGGVGDEDGGGWDGGGGFYGYYGGYGFAGSAATVKAAVGKDVGAIASYDLANSNQPGAAAAEAGLKQAASIADATATDGTGSAVLEGAKWDSQVVTWSVGTGVDEAAAAQAFASWAQATGLTFQEVSDPSKANIQIDAADLGTDGTGIVGYTTYAAAKDGALAHATVRVESTDQTALVTNASGQQVYAGTDATLSQTLLHEIGHALGFADTSDQASVMYYALGANNRALDATDVSGGTSLYGGATNLAQLTQASAAFDSSGSSVSSLVAANDDAQASPLLAAGGH